MHIGYHRYIFIKVILCGSCSGLADWRTDLIVVRWKHVVHLRQRDDGLKLFQKHQFQQKRIFERLMSSTGSFINITIVLVNRFTKTRKTMDHLARCDNTLASSRVGLGEVTSEPFREGLALLAVVHDYVAEILVWLLR